MANLKNLEVTLERNSGGGGSYVAFTALGDDRYHVWLDENLKIVHGSYDPNGTVYKNSVAKHGEVGHYRTRKLDAGRGTGKAMLEHMLHKAVDLKAGADAAYDAKEAVAAEATKVRARLVRIERNAEAIYNVLKAMEQRFDPSSETEDAIKADACALIALIENGA